MSENREENEGMNEQNEEVREQEEEKRKIEALMRIAPKKIYLQYFGDEDRPDLFDDKKIDAADVTWAQERVWELDIEYTRSDLPSPDSGVLEAENARLRAVIVDTDKLFSMIDEYFTGLPGLVPEEKKIQSLIGKMLGKRMATRAVEEALSRHQKEG